jgi:acyl carrier protein
MKLSRFSLTVGTAALVVVIADAAPHPLAALVTAQAQPSAKAPASAKDQASVVDRLRTELATLLKKKAEQLPADKPVAELGADELTVIEWQMAAERAFRVYIDDEKLFDKKPTLRTRKDLTITSMAAVVAGSKPWPPGKTK